MAGAGTRGDPEAASIKHERGQRVMESGVGKGFHSPCCWDMRKSVPTAVPAGKRTVLSAWCRSLRGIYLASVWQPGNKDKALGHEREKVEEPGGAAGKKNPSVANGVVLLRALTVFTVFS